MVFRNDDTMRNMVASTNCHTDNKRSIGAGGRMRAWRTFALLSVLAIWAAPSPAITVDGQTSPGEWNNANVIISSPRNPALDPDFDIQRIMMADGHHSLYVSLSVWGDHPELTAQGSSRPYLNFYFNLYSGGGAPHRFGLTYNDGYGFPRGYMHLIEYDSGWKDLGTVNFAIDKTVEAEIPWSMLPADLTAGGPIAAQSLFFLYNVAPGDANGDGKVDVLDLGALASNWGKVGGVTWRDGDFNLDGRVDVLDLGILATHWQYHAPGAGQYDLFDQYTTVDRNVPLTNHAPEPLTLCGVALGFAVAGRYLRRRIVRIA